MCHYVSVIESRNFRCLADVASATQKFPGLAVSVHSTTPRAHPDREAGFAGEKSLEPSQSSSLLSVSVSVYSPTGGTSLSKLLPVARDH